MDSEKFLVSIESNLTPMAPEFIPGIIKKQMDQLGLSYRNMTPGAAQLFISNVADALIIFIGPERSRIAKKVMLRKLRECCSDTEVVSLHNY